MKHKNLVLLVPFFVVSLSCDIKKGKTVKAADPMTFDEDWKEIRKACNSKAEALAINRFIEHLNDESVFDSTGYEYAVNYSYEDIQGHLRPVADLFNKHAKDSLKTIIIEVSPYIQDKIVDRQIYKNWKPKDFYNLRYFMDGGVN